MATPVCMANCWIGAEPDMMDEHEEKLVKVFLDEYEKITSTKLDFDDFYLQVKLAHASVLFGCCANVRWLKTLIKDWSRVKDRRDPQVDDLFLCRCYYVQVEMFLAMWRKRSPYPHWQKWMERTKMPRKHP